MMHRGAAEVKHKFKYLLEIPYSVSRLRKGSHIVYHFVNIDFLFMTKDSKWSICPWSHTDGTLLNG
jgi:hypothetical protein